MNKLFKISSIFALGMAIVVGEGIGSSADQSLSKSGEDGQGTQLTYPLLWGME